MIEHLSISKDNAGSFTRAFAEDLDQNDPLRHLRKEFVIPSKADLKRKTLSKPGMGTIARKSVILV